MNKVDILGVPIAAIDLDQAANQIEYWIVKGRKVYVTVTGVHGIMESQYNEEVKRIHRNSAMCVPDGMPTVWIGKIYGHKKMGRVYGPDLMLEMIKRSSESGYTNFFYGGKTGVPERLQDRLSARFPGLRVVGTLSPPFGPMNDKEEDDFRELIRQLSPDIMWVGLSTPKQEIWMATHLEKLDTRVMIGVGAAFDFHSGLVRQAPAWIQKCGFEWFFRMCVEPRRLWRRYLYNNPRFVWLMLLQLLRLRRYDAETPSSYSRT